MNHRDRFVRTLTGQEVDRVPFIKVFGGTNAVARHWEAEHPGIGRCIDQLLRFEGVYRGWQIAPVEMDLTSLGPNQVLEDTETARITRRGDGLVERVQKDADYSQQVLEWPVKDREDWDRVKERHLRADDPERFPAAWEAAIPAFRVRDYPLQLTHWGVYGFARKLMGDERLAYAFYDDPGLVEDIMTSYTDMALTVWGRMVEQVQFDLIECWEDMAYRRGSIISPVTFRHFMKPQYQRIRQFADAHDIPLVLVDSDGYIEPLTKLMLESGVNALYPYEVQSGNDVGNILHQHSSLGAIGGLDKRCMATNRQAIDAEIARARELIRIGRFIPGPDHFVLSDVPFSHYRYFMEQLRKVVLSTRPGA